MLKNYLVIALRNLYKFKAYALINIVGLGLAVACCLFLLLFLHHEWSYDAFHKNAGRIFRVNASARQEKSVQIQATTPAPLGPAIKFEVPGVQYVSRFLSSEYAIKYGEKLSTEKVTFTDPDFLKIFSFQIVTGQPEKLLKDKNSLVISQELARKYFGEGNPVGEHFTLIRLGKYYDFTVSGVMRKAPDNSSIQYGILIPFEKLHDFLKENYFTNWGLFSVRTYLQIFPGLPAGDIESLISRLVRRHDHDSNMEYHLQPLRDVHFASSVQAAMTPASSSTYSFILISIAILIVLVAGFNSMNLTASMSAMRAREIGVRKVLGARKSQIIFQLCTESTLIVVLAFLLGLFLSELLLPVFKTLSGKSLTFAQIQPSLFLGSVLTLIVCLGFFPSLFPAILLADYNQTDLYLHRSPVSRTHHFTKWLITVQFGMSVFLISCTLLMADQLNFLRKTDLGFKSEQIVVIPFDGERSQQTLDAYRSELKKYPDIVNVSGAISYPGGNFHSAGVRSEEQEVSAIHIKIDYDFIDTFGMYLKEGRNFSRSIASDTTKALIVNEAFVRQMGWKSALGKKAVIEWQGWETEIIGVVSDFHYASFHEKIGPLVFYLDPYVPLYYFFVKMQSKDISRSFALLEDKWHLVTVDQPFDYFFLDKKLNHLYSNDEYWQEIMLYASILALLITCFGLIGFSSLTLSGRTKEIGIRKVVGASFNNLIRLLSREFLKAAILANLIAWPFAWYVMDRWLQNFSYKTAMSLWTFVLAGAVVLVIAFLSVSSQVIKAALANPLDSLRYE